VTAPLLTAEEAAALLNVSKWWVLQEARANRIPHVRLGRNVRFEAAALEDWWRARMSGPILADNGGVPTKAGRRRTNAPAHGPQESDLP
jgi:excisionase family DNA binding protein